MANHRKSGRIPHGVRVVLYWSGIPILPGRMRDVSDRGLFVETDPNQVVRGGTIEVGMWLGRSVGAHQRIRTRVIRKEDDGVALAIAPDDKFAGRILRGLVEEAAGDSAEIA